MSSAQVLAYVLTFCISKVDPHFLSKCLFLLFHIALKQPYPLLHTPPYIVKRVLYAVIAFNS